MEYAANRHSPPASPSRAVGNVPETVSVASLQQSFQHPSRTYERAAPVDPGRVNRVIKTAGRRYADEGQEFDRARRQQQHGHGDRFSDRGQSTYSVSNLNVGKETSQWLD